MNDLMYQLYGKYKENLTSSNKHKNKLLDIIKSNEFFVLVNEYSSDETINPVLIPFGKNDIAFMIFENEILVNKYSKLNKLEDNMKVKKINENIFCILVQTMYLKGINSVILNTNLDDNEVTLYYPIIELVNYEKGRNYLKGIFTKNKQDLISYLNFIKLKNKLLSCIYDEKLTSQEVMLYLVKYKIFNENGKKNIKLFIDEDLGDDFAIKNKLIKNGEPMNITIHNGVLLASLCKLKEKVDLVYFYTNEKVYKINLSEFIELLSLIGFEYTDLLGE